MIRVDIKPMSVNRAWQGKRFKTNDYKEYERTLLLMLPKILLPKPPYSIYFEFGMSNHASDLDNPVKPTMDILQKKYGFNDKDVMEAHIKKVKTEKGKDYFIFNIKEV